MAFVDKTVANDFSSLAQGEYPNLTGLKVAIDNDPELAPIYNSSRMTEDGGLVTVRFFFSASLTAAQLSALDSIVSDHLAGDDEPSADQSTIENVGQINGVNFSDFKADFDSHQQNTSNPHDTGLGDLQNFSLATLNAKISDGVLDDSSSSRTPTSHSSTHVDGGSDPIDHNDLAGLTQGDPHTQYLNLARFNSELSSKSTDDLSEGSNLYFTESRVDNTPSVSSNSAHAQATGNPHNTTASDVGAVDVSEKAQPNGVATLDGSGKIPAAQIPASARPSFKVVQDLAERDALTPDEGDEVFVQANSLQYIWDADNTSWFERPVNPNQVNGPPASVDNTVSRYDGTTGKVIQSSGVSIDDSDNVSIPGNLTVVGSVNGVDVSAVDASLTSHINNTSNPHSVALGDLPAFSLADLNSQIQDGNVDRSTDARPPTGHGSDHHLGGSDPIILQSLSSNGVAAGLVPQSNSSGGFDMVPPEAMDVRPVISLFVPTAGSNLSNSSFQPIVFDGVNKHDTDYFDFSIGEANVTILVSGQYSLHPYMHFEQSAGNNRSEASFRVVRNGNQVPGMIGYTYSRQISQGRGGSPTHQVLDLNAGDVIRVEGRRISGNGTLRPAANACGLVIVLEQGIRGPQGLQGPPGVGTTITVNDDGVSSGQFDTLNFVNADVVDAGGGVADVTIEPVVTRFSARNEAILSFADGSPRTRVSLSQAVPNGTYELIVYAEHWCTNTSTEWGLTLNSDGSEIAYLGREPDDNDDTFQFNYYDWIDVTTGQVDIDLIIQRFAGSGTINIRKARIFLKKI